MGRAGAGRRPGHRVLGRLWVVRRPDPLARLACNVHACHGMQTVVEKKWYELGDADVVKDTDAWSTTKDSVRRIVGVRDVDRAVSDLREERLANTTAEEAKDLCLWRWGVPPSLGAWPWVVGAGVVALLSFAKRRQ